MCRKNVTSANALTASAIAYEPPGQPRATRAARMARALLVLLAGALALPGHATAGARAEPLVLRVGVESEIQGFDPLRTPVMGVATLTVARVLFDTLVDLDARGRVQPALALSLEPASDLSSWTATLRPGVLFHDGTPFDAAAVAGHFSRLLDPANKCACRPLIAPIARVVAVDARTVRFELSRPWAALPAVLGEPSVVSLIGSPRALADTTREFQRNPVGTGPFVLEQWASGDRVVVRREARHWRAADATLERIEFRVLPDEQTRLAALRSGDLDVTWTQSPASALKARSEQLPLVTQVGAGARILVFNTRMAPLDDTRVRRALSLAIDPAELARVFSEQLAPPVTDPFGPDSAFSCPASDGVRHDLEGARALLREYGKPVRLKLLHTNTPRGLEAGQIMQALWGAAGAEIELVPVEQGQLVQRVLKGDYEIGAWRIRDSFDPDPDLYGLLHSQSPFNVTGLRSDAIDGLLLEGRTRLDVAERRTSYCALSRTLAEEAPFVYLAPNVYFAVTGARVQGTPGLQGGILDLRALSIAR
jgi:4-phytase/acid phosphatase/peptide/nickel transport system substrate-binding protein